MARMIDTVPGPPALPAGPLLPPGRHPLAPGLPEPWAAEWGQDRYGVFTAFAVGDVVQRLRWVPPGTFLMGSPEGEEGRRDLEGPRSPVTLTRGLWMGETPVTQALWRGVMDHNPSRFEEDGRQRPVECVSWDDCQHFLERLHRVVPGLQPRLPTEAEWERACRAGTDGARYGRLDEIAWHDGNSGNGTRSVKQRLPNALGLYDILGNVWEWCSDCLGPYPPGPRVDPASVSPGSRRVIRGGSWSNPAGNVRAAYRSGYPPGFRFEFLGFRLARGHDQQASQ
ncbi:MAG: hypothetical protein AMXMBFR64_27800 [Myxococcales bacterium]